MAKLVISTTEKVRREVKTRAASLGITITAIVLALLRMWLDGKVDVPIVVDAEADE